MKAVYLFILGLLIGSVVAQTAQQNFLNTHNSARTAVRVAALSWDNGVASKAAAHANKCEWGHSSGSGNGENIYASTGSQTDAALALAAVNSWNSEKQHFNCPSNSCASGKVCGHYTQNVWAKTTKLGCAVKKCVGGKPPGGWTGAWNYVVCQYNPPGNYVGQKPYPC